MGPLDLSYLALRPRAGFYTSAVEAPSGWPLRTFLPVGYEPNYPYPLLVFLHGHGGSEEQVLRLAPRLSRRNYVCIALRGPYASDDPLVEEYVLGAIRQTRRVLHVHSERIYLAGFCEGAALAYRLALLFPERFAGVVALNGALPRRGGPLLRLPEVRRLKVLIGHGIANAIVPLAMARQDYKLFYSAGMPVQFRTYPT